MTVQLDISYDMLVSLFRQLTPEARAQLLQDALTPPAASADLPDTAEAWAQRFRHAQIDAPVHEIPSSRREDWYDDERG